jgi:hypothetical protein
MPVDIEWAIYETFEDAFDADVDRKWYDAWGLGHAYTSVATYVDPDISGNWGPIAPGTPIQPQGPPPLPPMVLMVMKNSEAELKALLSKWTSFREKVDALIIATDPNVLLSAEEFNLYEGLKVMSEIAVSYQEILLELVGAEWAYSRGLGEYLKSNPERNLMTDPLDPDEVLYLFQIADGGDYDYEGAAQKVNTTMASLFTYIDRLKANVPEGTEAL